MEVDKIKIVKTHKSFEGETVFCSHESEKTKTMMNFSYFRPNSQSIENIIIWLSGLTCTEENFIAKSGIQKILADSKTMVVCPDTSPRGLNLLNEHDCYDFGSGASFYLNATTPGYCDHYQMEDYIIQELTPLIEKNFNCSNFSLSGHSMGGHGALTLGLKHPKLFRKISAFSPIVHPSLVAWGIKAFTGYLGEDPEKWKHYDACELIKSGHKHPSTILIDQGLSDEFLEEQLRPRLFENICELNHQALKINYQTGYDHSYYFIASFLQNHINYLIS